MLTVTHLSFIFPGLFVPIKYSWEVMRPHINNNFMSKRMCWPVGCLLFETLKPWKALSRALFSPAGELNIGVVQGYSRKYSIRSVIPRECLLEANNVQEMFLVVMLLW